MVFEEIHLRPLAGVDDVFQRQRMQAENPADLLDQRDVGEAGAVEPDDRPSVAMSIQVVDAGISRLSRICRATSVSVAVRCAAPQGRRSVCPVMRRSAAAVLSPAPAS
nr:hypothetical protein [Mesorhizobium sp. WSM2561]